MKRALFFFFVIILTPVLSFGADENQSDFERLVVQSNRPFPTTLEDLGLMLERNPQSSVFVNVPVGRSIQRNHADFRSPRQLRSIEIAGSPPTFIGYASRNQQLEILSWIPAKKKYQFLEVSHFSAGHVPEVKRANRDLCVSCHQNEGPLFSRFPWRETNFDNRVDQKLRDSDPDLFQSFRASGGAFTFDRAVRRAATAVQAGNICTHLCGENEECRRALLATALVTKLIFPQAGSELITSSKLILRSDAPTVEAFRTLNRIFAKLPPASWTENRFAYPSSVLPDRDPFSDSKNGGAAEYFTAVAPLEFIRTQSEPFELYPSVQRRRLARSRALTFEEDFSTDSLEAVPGVKALVSNGIHSGDFADPTTRRPAIHPIEGGAEAQSIGPELIQCFGLTDSIQSLFKRSTPERIVAQIIQAPAIGRLLKQKWPISESELLPTLRTTFSIPVARLKSSGSIRRGLSSGVLDSELEARAVTDDAVFRPNLSLNTVIATASPVPAKLSAAEKTRTLQSFNTYCTKCHGPGEPLAFGVSFQDADALRKFRGLSGKSIIERLQTGTMPPADQKQPTADERRAMIRVLGP